MGLTVYLNNEIFKPFRPWTVKVIMKHLLLVSTVSLWLGSCAKEPSSNTTFEKCEAQELNDVNYNSIIDGLDDGLIERAVEKPNEVGALGRNKKGYFHVRFQMNITKLTDAAVKLENVELLQAFSRNLDYCFSYQDPDGGFQLNPPEDLVNNPNIPPASEGDVVSGVAFFAYSLGISLMTLENSKWYSNQNTMSLSDNVLSYTSNITQTLNYLKANKERLDIVDKHAPNRLLFDAVAFYTLGQYLDDAEAQNIGLDFAGRAFDQVDDKGGYFIKGGGWDSSYNGVALKLGLEFYSLLPDSEPLKESLDDKLLCAASWQVSRILPSGEVSTEGNTRVFPGGESFLGNTKSVDVEKTIKALLYLAVMTNTNEYMDMALRVLEYYD